MIRHLQRPVDWMLVAQNVPVSEAFPQGNWSKEMTTLCHMNMEVDGRISHPGSLRLGGDEI